MSDPEPINRSGTTTTWDIPTIVRNGMSGRLRIPQFQRSFVWTAGDVRRLFDSIYRGFPIGTLLLWQQELPAGRVTFGPVSLDAPPVTDGFWVVDGQQRVTSLVGALSPITEVVDERFEVYFDLSKRRFVGPIRGARPPRAIPVREALESRRLLNWLREYGEDLEDGDLEVADQLGGALRDYRVPAYLVVDASESLLREVFDRVNSAGKPISRAQVFHALFGHGGSSNASPQSVSDRVEAAGFGRIEEGRVVQSLLAIRGGDVQRDLHDEFDSTEDPADWYDHTTQALLKTVDFLREAGIPHSRLLPVSFPIPVLAAFFHLHPEVDAWTRRLLARWLWRGMISGFGREGGQTPALRRAIRDVNPVKSDPSVAPSAYGAVKTLLESIPVPERLAVQTSPFAAKNANARLLLLAMLSLEPRGPGGEVISIPGALNEYGNKAIGQLVAGSQSDAATRSFWLPSWPRFSGHEDPEVLRSHAVTDDAANKLRYGAIDEFLEIRGEELRDLSRSFLELKVERKGLVRPPLESLIVGDPEKSDLG